MKVNGIKFVYRGTDHTGLGQAMASLLEEKSVEYAIGSVTPNADSTHVSADLGALLRTLDEKVITKPKATPLIRTAVPPVHIRDRVVLQWLRGMNIPIGVPVTLQFVNDIPWPDTAQ